MSLKRCFRTPIPEIFTAAQYLNRAINAHLNNDIKLAKSLFVQANDRRIWEWTDSIWGRASPYVIVVKKSTSLTKEKVSARMPTLSQKRDLHLRDGFHCRYCEIPVIRPEIRKLIHKLYPYEVPWGRSNASQHAAFQCMWAQYDHVTPHSHGGTNELSNLVVTCAACNYGKMQYTLDELGLADPRDFSPLQSEWDGLERLKPLGAFNPAF